MLHLLPNFYINTTTVFIISLLLVVLYEIINGFHDSANALVIVVHTKVLSPKVAIIYSSIFNFLGVFFGGLSVAYAIIHLFPLKVIFDTSSNNGIKMITSVLIVSIFWNFLTWYLCLPISSSHTLLGSILGVSCIDALIKNISIIQVLNILNFKYVFLSFIISPIIGLFFSGLLLLFFKKILNKFYNKCYINFKINNKKKSYKKNKPSLIMKIMLILSSFGVSYSHGANDGQKGVGLMMLILIILTPSQYFINFQLTKSEIHDVQFFFENFKTSIFKSNEDLKKKYFFSKNNSSPLNKNKYEINSTIFITNEQKNILYFISYLEYILNLLDNFQNLTYNEKNQIRKHLLCINNIIKEIICTIKIKEEKIYLNNMNIQISKLTQKTPFWVIFLIALSISIGTTMGWKRIFKTIGTKIGKKKITYEQAISAQIATALSVGFSSYFGFPISTTHILSSSITGAILFDGFQLQMHTIKNIIYAWFFTFPIVFFLSGFIYWLLLKI
ncbi:inorganic phosphate transporter [Buchnera aphidicola (Mollitrichosiphum nigrofasciatum)]|uniref:inorganic phosphate transporter n=1 Tax=Buchnera aphidicola TaxID=9 RepID=UPI0031B8B192